MSDLHDTDIFVSGGGVAGLAATIAFAQAGFTTLCADPAPPIITRDAEGADLRTTVELFQELVPLVKHQRRHGDLSHGQNLP